MEKILNYIRNGRGVGLLFILAASVLITLAIVLLAKDFYAEARVQMMTVAEDFLPLTVEKGIITKPADTYKRVNIDFGKQGNPKDMFSIILNTRDGVAVSAQDAQGLYLLKNQIYVITPTQMRHYNLQDGVWDMERFKQFADDLAGVIFGAVSVVLICMLFVVCLIKTLAAAALGVVFQKVMKRGELFDFSALMRLCAVMVAVLEILRWSGIFAGVNLTGLSVFAVVSVLEFFFLFKEIKAQD